MDDDAELKAYLASLQERLAVVEKTVTRMAHDTHLREERLDASREELRLLAERTRGEIAETEHRLKEEVRRMGELVVRFKTTVRQRDLERLRQRIDAWKLDRCVSRDELKRVVARAQG